MGLTAAKTPTQILTYTGIDDRGIRARGTSYRTTINNLKTAKAKHKALNTKRTQKVLYYATKKYNVAKITVTKATAKSYEKGTVKSSFWGRLRSWLGI